MDTLTSIRVFSRIVELGSMTAAAADLGISNAMVSKHLKYLESMLEVRLIQRTTRSTCLTDEGRACYDSYKIALQHIDGVKSSCEAAKGMPNGTLRITAPNYVADRYLQPVIASYISRHPNMRLDVGLTDDMANIVEDGIDLALWVASTLPPSLIARRLKEIEQVVVASPDYLARHGRPTAPADLRSHMVLALGNSGATWSFLRDGSRVDIGLERYMIVDSRFAFRLAVDGMGIATLPLGMVEDRIASGGLEVLLSDYELPVRHLYAVYPSRSHLPAKVRAFMDLLAEAFRQRSLSGRLPAPACQPGESDASEMTIHSAAATDPLRHVA